MPKILKKAKTELADKHAQFEAEKKKEKWGLLVLKKMLHAAEDKLAKERRQWHEACKKDKDDIHKIQHINHTN
ncbi:hypothetical protein Hanom_Chr07g00626941 [Helianthus anomalus]